MKKPKLNITPIFNHIYENNELHTVWLNINITRLGQDRVCTQYKLPRAALSEGGVISTDTDLGRAVKEATDKMIKEAQLRFETLIAMNEIVIPQDIGNYLRTYSGGRAYAMLLSQLRDDYVEYKKHSVDGWAPNPKNPNEKGASEKALRAAVNSFSSFMYDEHKMTDIPIDKVTIRHLTRFEISLRKAGKSPNTVSLYIKELMAQFQYAFKQGFIATFPFKDYSSDRLRVTTEGNPEMLERIISKQDLARIRDTAIEDNAEMERIRLLFIFQTWTGMSYIDMFLRASIKESIGFDMSGNKAIIYTRQKTTEPAIIPMFPETEELINKLGRNVSPGKYNDYAKGLRKMWKFFGVTVKADKVTHVGRHLFGNEMLEMGFSMEAVSRMMGHKSIKQTEGIYAKVNTTKIFADLERIRKQNMDIKSKQTYIQPPTEISA